MNQDELRHMIEEATEEQLRDIVREWMETNGEFKAFVEHSLNPPADEIDFDKELGRGLGMQKSRLCPFNGVERRSFVNN